MEELTKVRDVRQEDATKMGGKEKKELENLVPPLEVVPEMLERINISESKRNKTSSSKTEKLCKHAIKTSPAIQEFGGMKKGFLAGNKQKSLSKSKNKEKDIPFIKAQPSNSGLLLKEVQEAMTVDNSYLSAQSNLTNKITSHPKVTDVLSDPAWMEILDEFQQDPENAMIKYKDNKEVKNTIQELCSILGDSFLHMTSPPKTEEEALCKQLVEDPLLKEALSDPFIKVMMNYMKTGQNDKVRECMVKASPSEKSKLQMLIDYGLFSFAS